MIYRLEFPIADPVMIRSLSAGDFVKISGTIYTARDQAHKRLLETARSGGKLPIELTGTAIYYCGPTPVREDGLFGSAGPTTASRMDKMAPELYRMGLAASIGKGERSESVRQACVEYTAVYLATFGGAGAYLAKRIVKQELVAYGDLGAEAIYRLVVEDFPAIVGFDTKGGTIF